MILASRVNRGFAAASLLAAGLICGTAAAQSESPEADGGPAVLVPRRLTPETEPRPLEAPPAWSADTSAPQPEEAAAGEDTPASPKGIEVGELVALDPDSGGTLEESMGGLGIDMWDGTDRATLERLLPQLPASMNSPGLRELARRLLLSTAIVPPAPKGAPGASIVGIRVGKLEAMGLTGAVVDMIQIASTRETDPALVRATIGSRLALGDAAGACDSAERSRGKYSGAYWQQVAIFCKTHAGDLETAALETNILAESGDVEDPAFFTLADILITRPKKAHLDSMPNPTPLLLAMATAAGVKIPSDVLETDSALILRAVANNPNVSADVRLDAAERAAAAGAAGPGWLAEKYAEIEFSAEELASAISRAESKRTPRIRALLFQAANLQELPVTRAAAIQKAWDIARQDGNYLLMARLYLPLLEQIAPSGELIWFAADAARAFYVLRRPARARLWGALADRLAADTEYLETATLLWPIARLAGGGDSVGGIGSRDHKDWVAALGRKAGVDAGRRIGLTYMLFEALGEEVPDDHWRALLDRATYASALAPDPAFLRAYRQAAADGRRGETVLLALLVLGAGGTEEAGPDLMAEILVGLRLVGLEEESRQLAVESALRNGI